ncbi:hypothetical protein M9Y10_017230 [Tritrichomonas musculus]|uniref:HNH nuclease domain-containing protein n=1 Tax=Tritrichomonas musculus TaxID=1915356 RepID=A0ABR2HVN6_9EUKA
MSYIELLDHPDYEILNEYPFTIRRKDNHFEPSESYDNGYIRVNLNNKSYSKHRLVAEQFIPNDDPEHKTQVDHINKNRSDYHLNNLRWVTPSENQRNKTSSKSVEYEYFDEIPEEAFMIDTYETKNGIRYFNEGRYYYYFDEESDEDVFYSKITNDLYRRLHININKHGTRYVNTKYVNGKVVAVCINKFKRQYDL